MWLSILIALDSFIMIFGFAVVIGTPWSSVWSDAAPRPRMWVMIGLQLFMLMSAMKGLFRLLSDLELMPTATQQMLGQYLYYAQVPLAFAIIIGGAVVESKQRP